MSDFFERIISRSFADAAAVRPRLPARFEAQGRDLPGVQALPNAFETEKESARPATTASTRGRTDHPAERRDEEEEPRERPRRDEPARAPSLRTFPMTARPRPAEEVAAPPVSPRKDGPLASLNDSAPTTLQPRAQEGEREQASPRAKPPQRAQAPAAAEAARSQGQAKHDASTDASRAAPPAIVPRLTPQAPELRAVAAYEAMEAAPANVVQVSIGRIEVTVPAQPPRTPPRRAPPAPLRPAHSLDDYLRRREGSGR